VYFVLIKRVAFSFPLQKCIYTIDFAPSEHWTSTHIYIYFLGKLPGCLAIQNSKLTFEGLERSRVGLVQILSGFGWSGLVGQVCSSAVRRLSFLISSAVWGLSSLFWLRVYVCLGCQNDCEIEFSILFFE